MVHSMASSSAASAFPRCSAQAARRSSSMKACPIPGLVASTLVRMLRGGKAEVMGLSVAAE